jgi:hypothetical protein
VTEEADLVDVGHHGEAEFHGCSAGMVTDWGCIVQKVVRLEMAGSGHGHDGL